MWIGPSRNLLIIEKVRISGRRFSYPPRRWKARDTFFHGLVRGDSRAVHFAKTWLRGTRKRSRSGFILHLWQRARMLFLSKLSPIWNIRSLALCTDTFLVFFSFYPDASAALKNRIFRYSLSKRFRRWLRGLAEKCRNADVGSPSCRSYDLCLSNGNDGCCNFLCHSTRDMCHLIDVLRIRERYR